MNGERVGLELGVGILPEFQESHWGDPVVSCRLQRLKIRGIVGQWYIPLPHNVFESFG